MKEEEATKNDPLPTTTTTAFLSSYLPLKSITSLTARHMSEDRRKGCITNIETTVKY